MKSLILLFFTALVLSLQLITAQGAENKIVKVRLESCPGCSLNRLPEVRKFFYEDVPKYENVEWKKIGGAPPEAIFLDAADEEVERHLLSRLTREECNELLQKRGFKPTENESDGEL